MEHEGFIFHVGKSFNGRKYYDCAMKKKLGCQAKLTSVDGGPPNAHIEHNHAAPRSNEMLLTFKNRLRQRAVEETTSLRTIYVEEAASHVIAASSYSWPTAESLMRLARKRSQPRIPQTFEDVVRTMDNADFRARFLVDGQPFFRSLLVARDGSKSLVFCSQSLLDLVVAGATTMGMDATFKVVPATPAAHQLLIIHVLKQTHMIPVVYVLMERKSQVSYEEVLFFFSIQLAPTFMPTEIISDYEKALQNAVRRTYPNSRVIGCWFHFNQAIIRKSRQLGHERLIRGSNEASIILKMIMALPLLPSDRLLDGYELILERHNTNQVEMGDLLAYVQRFWLTRVGPEIISVFGAEYRTNNHVERFHKELALIIREVHPNMWTFLGKLILINSRKQGDVLQLNNGLRVARGRAFSNIQNNRRIRREQRDLMDGVITIRTFLERTSHAVDGLNQRFVDVPDVEEGYDDMDEPPDVLEVNPIPVVGEPEGYEDMDEIPNEVLEVNPTPVVGVPEGEDLAENAAALDDPQQLDDNIINIELNDDLQFEQPPLEAFEVPEIEELQLFFWTPTVTDTECDMDDIRHCTICFAHKIACSLECGHIFCITCCQRIFNFRMACPFCRVVGIRDPLILHITI